MPRRPLDWYRQALRNLRAAEALAREGLYEEACFEAHQAAEKAVKAVLNALGAERRGHTITHLARLAAELGSPPPSELRDCIALLDKQYIPAMHPDVYDEGAPGDFYTRRDAEECIRCARAVLNWAGEALREILGGETEAGGALRVEGEGGLHRGE